MNLELYKTIKLKYFLVRHNNLDLPIKIQLSNSTTAKNENLQTIMLNMFYCNVYILIINIPKNTSELVNI